MCVVTDKPLAILPIRNTHCKVKSIDRRQRGYRGCVIVKAKRKYKPCPYIYPIVLDYVGNTDLFIANILLIRCIISAK
jgi:hypothetical protein